MYEISSETYFSAAHRLNSYNGPCENLHGHNWGVRAFVRCESLNDQGISIDFKLIHKYLTEVVSKLDHTDLNILFDERGENPSSENIARYIFKQMQDKINVEGCRLQRVEVYETPKNGAAYFEYA